jgi:5-methylcytosine-specific restriction endonuclease McrA
VARASRHLLRLAAETDSHARLVEDLWQTRCLHCRTVVTITHDGVPLGSTTLEHIVPRSWFGRRLADDLTRTLAGPDDPLNLALACARCNQQKGRGPDADGPADERARTIVARLLTARRARFRPSSGEHAHDA